jgi:hypothetical protein
MMMYKKCLPVLCVLLLYVGCASTDGYEAEQAPASGEFSESAGGPETETTMAAVPEDSAATGEIWYTLEDPGLILALPENLAVFTRTESRNRQIMDAAQLDSSVLRRFMRETRCYLYALNQDLSQEILLTVFANDSRDYHLLTDEELGAIADSAEMGAILAALGNNSRVYGSYRSASSAWFIIDIQQTAGDRIIYGCEYYTVINGKAITLTLQSSSGAISTEQYALLKATVDSLSLTFTL